MSRRLRAFLANRPLSQPTGRKPRGNLSNFEIYGDDPETLAAFYRELLGWRIEKAEGVDYWRIAIGAEAAPLAAGGIARRPAFAQHGWMNFVEVESLDAALKAAERLGGAISNKRPPFRAPPGMR